MEFSICYITCASIEEAKSIVHTLLSEKLIACANINDNICSIYPWNGEIQEDNEVLVFAKTRSILKETVCQRVTDLHSYECPCIAFFELNHANQPYLDWLDKEIINLQDS